VIHEYAGEIIARRPVHKRSRHGGIHAAAHRAQHFFIADFFLQRSHHERRIYGVQFHPEVVHTQYGENILKNFLYGVCHAKGDWTMRVELYAVNSALVVAECRHGAGARLRIGKAIEAFRRAGNVIGMAHPTYARFGHSVKQYVFFNTRISRLPYSLVSACVTVPPSV